MLTKNGTLYIAVGGSGKGNGTHTYWSGGWNGGGNSTLDGDGNTRTASGGGCTSITNKLIGNGQLYNYSSYKSNIKIVAGGGGGNSFNIAWRR